MYGWDEIDILRLPARRFTIYYNVAMELLKYEQMRNIEAASFPYMPGHERRQLIGRLTETRVSGDRAWELLRRGRRRHR